MRLTSRRGRVWWGVSTILVLVAMSAGLLLWPRPPNITMTALVSAPFEHPADIQPFQNAFVVTQLFTSKLTTVRAGDLAPAGELAADRPLASPHFLAATPQRTLLVSEGWGSGVLEWTGQDGGVWRRFEGPPGDRMQAPHGVCVDRAGWIYVADSLNSRLVRFRDLDGSAWEVHPDPGRRISYGRQLLCRDDGVWFSNSYERREGLNPGTGGSVFRIVDFPGGDLELVAEFPRANITGIAVVGQRWLVVGLFSSGQLLLYDIRSGTRRVLPRPPAAFGPPYGMHYDEAKGRLLVTFVGDIFQRTHPGGIAEYRVDL